MNKWLFLIAACFMLIGAMGNIPYILNSPSWKNILIEIGLVVFILIGFYGFYNQSSTKTPTDMVPVKDDPQ